MDEQILVPIALFVGPIVDQVYEDKLLPINQHDLHSETTPTISSGQTFHEAFLREDVNIKIESSESSHDIQHEFGAELTEYSRILNERALERDDERVLTPEADTTSGELKTTSLNPKPGLDNDDNLHEIDIDSYISDPQLHKAKIPLLLHK
ncbi:Aste57867_2567 [Aphanomyces stellatus]|uniref:Aste57867_2567 protein n=1 Tax=Aphanomyces stellatus TaxID=120398 RepID=A0A485K7T9_9STRA|nr:hypothetical protein As57867_002560 [Aphanomyces stellatus]VFT79763.1 Aste57867_2567 [Aphanomyces stellatus]